MLNHSYWERGLEHQNLQMFGLKLNNISNFHPLDVVGRGSESQLSVGANLKGLAHAKIIKKSVILFWLFNMTI